MRARVIITQALEVELPEGTDFKTWRTEKLGALSERYDTEEARCSGTPEEILVTTIEDVVGSEAKPLYQSSTINITEVPPDGQ